MGIMRRPDHQPPSIPPELGPMARVWLPRSQLFGPSGVVFMVSLAWAWEGTYVSLRGDLGGEETAIKWINLHDVEVKQPRREPPPTMDGHSVRHLLMHLVVSFKFAYTYGSLDDTHSRFTSKPLISSARVSVGMVYEDAIQTKELTKLKKNLEVAEIYFTFTPWRFERMWSAMMALPFYAVLTTGGSSLLFNVLLDEGESPLLAS
ncbi:hypothetical protein VNO77_31469 [Canavalia gladiata]|uniref:Uncharacterized protein n=1 Tax=Canavalia gladiata TaxID=3824 RepID=A0AAN9Q3Z6_CANGL